MTVLVPQTFPSVDILLCTLYLLSNGTVQPLYYCPGSGMFDFAHGTQCYAFIIIVAWTLLTNFAVKQRALLHSGSLTLCLPHLSIASCSLLLISCFINKCPVYMKFTVVGRRPSAFTAIPSLTDSPRATSGPAGSLPVRALQRWPFFSFYAILTVSSLCLALKC